MEISSNPTLFLPPGHAAAILRIMAMESELQKSKVPKAKKTKPNKIAVVKKSDLKLSPKQQNDISNLLAWEKQSGKKKGIILK